MQTDAYARGVDACSESDSGLASLYARQTASGAAMDGGPRQIGPYNILMELGTGGMGIVYGAVDTRLNRAVAIKRLKDGSGEAAKQRFEREACALARVGHPNVVQIFEVGSFEDQPYMVMEYIEGETLDAWLGRTQPDNDEILAVFRAAGQGLAAAHARGLVHRDFKPKNIMVGDDGRVRVVDFGLAQVVGVWPRVPEAGQEARLDAELESSAMEVDHSLEAGLTISGVAMGTPAYMAPEQFRGDETDPRTDQFAFCISLWEALYGARPFRARSLPRLSRKVRAGEIDELVDPWLLPRWLQAALRRGLSPQPSARWPSMEALLAELERPLRRPVYAWRSLVGASAMASMFALGLFVAPGAGSESGVAAQLTLAQHSEQPEQPASARVAAPASQSPQGPLLAAPQTPASAVHTSAPQLAEASVSVGAQACPEAEAARSELETEPKRARRGAVGRIEREVASELAPADIVEIDSSYMQALRGELEQAAAEAGISREGKAKGATPPAVLHGSVETAGAALGPLQPAAGPVSSKPKPARGSNSRAPRPEDYHQDFEG